MILMNELLMLQLTAILDKLFLDKVTMTLDSTVGNSFCSRLYTVDALSLYTVSGSDDTINVHAVRARVMIPPSRRLEGPMFGLPETS